MGLYPLMPDRMTVNRDEKGRLYAEYQKKLKLKQLKNRDKDFPCILAEKFAVKKNRESIITCKY